MGIDETILQKRKRNAGALIMGGYLAMVFSHSFRSPDYHQAIPFAIVAIGVIMLLWGLNLVGKHIRHLEKRIAELQTSSPVPEAASPNPEKHLPKSVD